eukprot:6174410-Pleurochrysis_carterae.AAC.8
MKAIIAVGRRLLTLFGHQIVGKVARPQGSTSWRSRSKHVIHNTSYTNLGIQPARLYLIPYHDSIS